MTVVLVLILLGFGIYLLKDKIFPATNSVTQCTGVFVEKGSACPTGKMDSGVGSCKNKQGKEYTCCEGPLDIGQRMADCNNASHIVGGSTNAKGNDATKTGGAGNSGATTGSDTVLLYAGDITDPDLTSQVQSGKTYTPAIGDKIKLVTWLEGKDKICSITLRDITNEGNPISITDAWFEGRTIRGTCDQTNKKAIIITPLAGAAGKRYKLDIMVFNNTDTSKVNILASATVYVNVVGTPTTNQATQTANVHKTGTPSVYITESNVDYAHPVALPKGPLQWYEDESNVSKQFVRADSGMYEKFKMWNDLDSVDPKCQVLVGPCMRLLDTKYASPSSCGVGNEAQLLIDYSGCASKVPVNGLVRMTFVMETYTGDTKTGSFTENFEVNRTG